MEAGFAFQVSWFQDVSCLPQAANVMICALSTVSSSSFTVRFSDVVDNVCSTADAFYFLIFSLTVLNVSVSLNYSAGITANSPHISTSTETMRLLPVAEV